MSRGARASRPCRDGLARHAARARASRANGRSGSQADGRCRSPRAACGSRGPATFEDAAKAATAGCRRATTLARPAPTRSPLPPARVGKACAEVAATRSPPSAREARAAPHGDGAPPTRMARRLRGSVSALGKARCGIDDADAFRRDTSRRDARHGKARQDRDKQDKTGQRSPRDAASRQRLSRRSPTRARSSRRRARARVSARFLAYAIRQERGCASNDLPQKRGPMDSSRPCT